MPWRSGLMARFTPGATSRPPGGVAANYIARWDGVQWHTLGSGMGGGIGPRVSALAFGPDGSLYAGGRFDVSGGVTTNNIARWDGTQWQPLGSGMAHAYEPTVFALAVGPDSSLYTGGYFGTAGGVAAPYIARWDGTQWHPLGSGLNGSVYALAVGLDGALFAGGNFTAAGGVAANYVAHWGGVMWEPLPLGSGIGGSVVSALMVGDDGLLYAGGSFTTAGGVAVKAIARWDGIQWHSLGSGLNGHVYALAVGPDGSSPRLAIRCRRASPSGLGKLPRRLAAISTVTAQLISTTSSSSPASGTNRPASPMTRTATA